MTEGRKFFSKLFGVKEAEAEDDQPDVLADAGNDAAAPDESAKPGRQIRQAKFQIGQVVRHRMFPFRGVIFDVDPTYSNSEEWYNSIPEEVRPHRDQPYYHLFAENEKTHYIAYVSEQNLLVDDNPDPVDHPEITDFFDVRDGGYELKQRISN